jgi:rhomboid protease GluP
LNNPPEQPSTPQPPEPIRVEPVRVAVRLPVSTPWMTYLIMGITILMFLAQLASQYLLGDDYPAALGVKINSYIIRGQYWRLLTPVLLHANIIHIAFNMWALFSFGRNLERSYGHVRFLLLYLVAGLAGNVASFWFSASASLGASTAVFGVVAAEAVYFYQNRQFFGKQASAALYNILSVIGVNLILGFTVSGIDNFGHLGGLVGGAAFAFLAGPLFGIEGAPPDLRLVDRRSGLLPWLVAAVESAGLFLLASLKIFA